MPWTTLLHCHTGTPGSGLKPQNLIFFSHSFQHVKGNDSHSASQALTSLPSTVDWFTFPNVQRCHLGPAQWSACEENRLQPGLCLQSGSEEGWLCALATVSLTRKSKSHWQRFFILKKEEEERESISPSMDTALQRVDLERYLNLSWLKEKWSSGLR